MITLACIYPIYWLVMSSLKTKSEFVVSPLSLPESLQFINYIKAFQFGDLMSATMNSLINVTVNVVLVVLAGTICGYFMARYDFRGKKLIYYTLLFGFLIPVYGLLVPVFLQFKILNLINTRYVLWFPYFAMQMPLAVFLAESFIKGIPVEIDEAAVIDGCSLNAILARIILPMCRPIISTITILTALATWNEFGFASVLIDEKSLRTIAIALRSYSTGMDLEYTFLMAALVIASAPILILYLVFSKQIINGFTSGAIKG